MGLCMGGVLICIIVCVILYGGDFQGQFDLRLNLYDILIAPKIAKLGFFNLGLILSS